MRQISDGCLPKILVTLARDAIWQLFEDGQLPQDSATLVLLAIDIGLRHVAPLKASQSDMRADLAERVRTT